MTALCLTAILPNYNHARFLPAALSSVIAQTRPPDELVIVDDASTDDSLEVILSFLPRLPNPRLVRNKSNIGAIKILNREMEAAKSDIVVSVNADDEIYPALFATGMTLFEQYPEAGIFSARGEYLDIAGDKLGLIPLPPPLTEPGFINAAAATRLLMRDYAWFIGPASLYRRQALLDGGGFLNGLGSFNDLYAAQYLAMHHGALFSPEVLAGWRRMPGGMAWQDTAELSRALAAIERVGRQIDAAGDAFPRGFARRWTGRYRYAAHRIDRAARRAATAPQPARLAETLLDACACAWSFATLRPWDLPTAGRRAMEQLLH